MSGGENALPPGWLQVSLGEIVDSITYGYTESATWDEVGPRFLRITDLQNGRVDWGSVPFCRCSDEEKYRLKSGDIVVARTGATTGKSFLLVDPPASCVFASYLIRLETNHNVSAAYLAEYLRSPAYWLQITEVKKGSAQPGVNASVLGGLDVSVAPLNEQKRIVAKIEALQARSNAAREALDAIPPLLEKFRQSVLAAAFRGDLTKAWREANPDVEPASELLERIRAERRRRWEEANPKKKYVEPEPVDTEGLPELPAGWCWASPREFFSWSSGNFLPTKHQRGGDIPVYGGNGVNGLHDLSLVDFRTLVVGRVGAHCGNVHLTSGRSWVTDNAIYASDGVDLAVLEFWQLRLSFENLNANSSGTGQPYVNQSHLNNLVVALPPEGEQRSLAKILTQILYSMVSVEATASQQLAVLENLNKTILAKAFRGELVPQDPNDEPASVLLERIRQERVSAAGGGPVRRGRPKKGE